MNGKAIVTIVSGILAFVSFLYYLTLGFYVLKIRNPFLYLGAGYTTTISILCSYLITFIVLYRFLFNKLSLSDDEISKIKTKKMSSNKVIEMKGLKLNMAKIIILFIVILVLYPIVAMMIIPPALYPHLRELKPTQIIPMILPQFVVIFTFAIVWLYIEFSGKWVDIGER